MRRTPIQRKTPFRSAPVPAQKRAASAEKPIRQLQPATRTATYAGTTTCQPVEKDVPCRPGKRTPTKAEREWMDWIVAYGCVACRADGLGYRPAAVHHLLRGGRRIGHLYTIPLCDPGHHQGSQPMGFVSRHPWKHRFERRYGSEEHLLANLRAIYEGGKR